MVTCPNCGTPNPEGQKFCGECGTALPAAQAGSARERKVVTVLFADVTGSTSMGENMDPEHFRDLMSAYANAVREVIEAEGGTVEKFIGDAVAAVFGVPASHEDDPTRALRAALGIQARLSELNEELDRSHGVTLRVRIGVNTGEALTVTVPVPGEAMATGDVVNTAARLQTAAEPGQILVAERTVRAVRGFEFDAGTDLALKGKSEPVRAYRLLDAAEGTIQERGVPGLYAPMVGRDREIELLRSLYARVVEEGRSLLATIYGDAGVGKSRLTKEFLSWAEVQEPTPLVLRGRCLPYGDGITYWPLAEILKGHCGILDTDPPDLAVEKVRKVGRELLTADVATDPARATAALAYTVGLEDPEISFADVDPRDVRMELNAAWRSFFSALASTGPVVVLVEDIHWADPVLLDLLEELSDRSVGPVLFVCPARPELTAKRPGWGGGGRNAFSVVLDPLSADDAERLIGLLLAVSNLPEEMREKILTRAEGNPFFLEEIVRRLIDGGSIFRGEGGWHAHPDIGEVEIPDTVQGVLASRIDLLDPSDKRVLQAAAVVGRVFWPGPVEELGAGDEDLDAAFRRLEGRELIFSRPGSSLAGQPEFLFKHILIRDVAYELLPRKERGAAHAVVARWLRRTAGDRASEFSELIAYHLATSVSAGREAGGVDEDLRSDAFAWILRAAILSRQRFVPRKAERLSREALDLAAGPLERTDALAALGTTFRSEWDGDRAWKYLREAAITRASTEPAAPELVANLALEASEVRIRWPGSLKQYIPTEDETKEMMDLAKENLPPGDTEVKARWLSAHAGWPFAFPSHDYTQEQIDSYEREGLDAAEIAIALGKPMLASAALDQAAGGTTWSGSYGKARELWLRRSEVIRQVTDPLEIGDFYQVGVWGHFELAEYEGALEIAMEGIGVIGSVPAAANAVHAWAAMVLHRIGRWDEAIEHFNTLRDLLDDRADDPPYFVSNAYGMAAAVHFCRGNRIASDEILEMLSRSDIDMSGRAYPPLMRALILRGEQDQAAALARPVNWQVHTADVYESESELLAAQARWDEAPVLLATMRAHAEAAPAPQLPAFADRLEGRMLLAGGDPVAAGELLERSRKGFAGLGVIWERALTEISLASALDAIGLPADAEAARASAAATFEQLGDVMNLALIGR
jgi:class 3 adenylate cyclase/tetratricopeptide (TPR) repeat protein